MMLAVVIYGILAKESKARQSISVQIPANFMSYIVFPIAAFAENNRIDPKCNHSNE